MTKIEGSVHDSARHRPLVSPMLLLLVQVMRGPMMMHGVVLL